MTPGQISRRVAEDRIAWVEAMLNEIGSDSRSYTINNISA